MNLAMVCEYDCLTLVSVKNKLVKICEEFSRIDFFLKKECTGRTRLMRKGIQTEKTSEYYQVFFKDYLIISW